MHFQDFCLLMLLAGCSVILASFAALSKKKAWWLDGLQIGGVMLAVAMVSSLFAPKKPVSIEKVTQEANAVSAARREQDIISAMTACDYAIQSNLSYPGSYSSTMFSTSNRQFETEQGWEVYKAFEAKNGFGGSLPHVGHCSIKRGGGITVEIERS
jgi:hypothetical protein